MMRNIISPNFFQLSVRYSRWLAIDVLNYANRIEHFKLKDVSPRILPN